MKRIQLYYLWGLATSWLALMRYKQSLGHDVPQTFKKHIVWLISISFGGLCLNIAEGKHLNVSLDVFMPGNKEIHRCITDFNKELSDINKQVKRKSEIVIKKTQMKEAFEERMNQVVTLLVDEAEHVYQQNA